MSVENELHRGGSAQDRRASRCAKRGTSKKGGTRFFWPPFLGGTSTTRRNDVSHGTTANSSHPFVIRVEEANLQNAAFTKVNATVLEDAVQVEEGGAASEGKRSLQGRKQEAEGKKKREKIIPKPFSNFFHFCKKRDQNTHVIDYKGTAPPSSPESFGAAVEERTHNHVLFRPVPIADFKRNGELPSLNILTGAAPTLPSFHNYDEPLEHESKELSSLYDLVSIKERGVGDFTSVDFDIESYGEGDNISVYDPRPATKASWSSSASVHLARSITAGIRPVLPLPPLERVLSVSDAILDGAQDSLENWMTRLHPEIRKIPLNHLFIPGSRRLQLQPDGGGRRARRPRRRGKSWTPAVRVWLTCHPAVVSDAEGVHGGSTQTWHQVLRHSCGRQGLEFFFVHRLYGGDLEPLLSEISHFLVRHPGKWCS
ncbi:uncharacterized protein [Macrobrachium rosenbergii]|uniref:uncharacterized protein n=1 Tax=Macrobrachium rosenbergii TaxID=79674 RepID=UPI0034D3AB85